MADGIVEQIGPYIHEVLRIVLHVGVGHCTINALEGQTSKFELQSGIPPSDLPLISSPVNRDTPGLRDVAVKKHSDWQRSQVHDGTLKIEFQKSL